MVSSSLSIFSNHSIVRADIISRIITDIDVCVFTRHIALAISILFHLPWSRTLQYRALIPFWTQSPLRRLPIDLPGGGYLFFDCQSDNHNPNKQHSRKDCQDYVWQPADHGRQTTFSTSVLFILYSIFNSSISWVSISALVCRQIERYDGIHSVPNPT